MEQTMIQYLQAGIIIFNTRIYKYFRRAAYTWDKHHQSDLSSF